MLNPYGKMKRMATDHLKSHQPEITWVSEGKASMETCSTGIRLHTLTQRYLIWLKLNNEKIKWTRRNYYWTSDKPLSLQMFFWEDLIKNPVKRVTYLFSNFKPRQEVSSITNSRGLLHFYHLLSPCLPSNFLLAFAVKIYCDYFPVNSTVFHPLFKM